MPRTKSSKHQEPPENTDNADKKHKVENNSKISDKVYVTPSKFYGDVSSDIESWLKEFDRVSVANRWDNSRKLEILPAYLRDRAADYFEDLDQEITTDYDRICEKLREKFRPKELQRAYYSDLFQRKQKENETVDDYGHAILVLARKAHNGIQRDVTDKLTMEHFIQGLRPTLKRLVLMTDPKSYEQALRIAKREECHENLTDKPTSSVCASVTDPEWHAAINALTQKVDDITKRLNTESQRGNSHFWRGGRGRSFRGRGRNLRTTDGQPICNFCHRVGHIEAKCWNKNGFPPQRSEN